MATVTAAAAPRLKRHVDAATAAPVKTDDNVLDLGQLVDELPFDNEDGGVWKQGWDVQPISNTSMLRIVVVPFSNCDPGRTLTLDYDYIEARKVLDTIVNSLLNDKRRTFIWPQINLLAQWWQHQDDDMRCDVRELLRNGQLELVSGGWTTPDEAVTTRYALEQQLQLGHDWIQTNLGAENLPRTAWSVPTLSGHSPTLAYLYQKYNVTTGIALYRVHYAIKKKLAQSRQLEFYWRISSGDGQRQQQQQQQQRNPHNDLWTHVMPFYTHDIPHTCGPNPETCCRFDFGRNSVGPCPWPAQPVLVNDDNVVEQAHMLLDQYRRKAALYRSHTLLVPLGGDYRYGTPDEAELQLLQYQRLFDYMNQFWKRTITERFVSESSTATVLDFHYDAHVKAVDQEWLVQFSTNITNSGYFHTDLNGLHFDTHRYRKDMPIQSQIFPMSTWASIHDQKRRFSVLSDHSKGVASLQEGAIDV
jgi:alpha-mannosidase II